MVAVKGSATVAEKSTSGSKRWEVIGGGVDFWSGPRSSGCSFQSGSWHARSCPSPPQHLMLSGCSTQLSCSCRAARAWRLSAPRHASRTVRTQARYAPPSDDIPGGPGDMYGMRPSGLATPREVLPSRELVEVGTKLMRNPSWYII